VCQLEFLAWLAHLEAEAGEDGDARRGYQRAQRDFLQRHLKPFLALLVEKLPQIQDSPVSDYFGELTALADTITRAIQGQLETITNGDSPMTNAEDSDQIAAVNLWG
jgi:TorA maturation chaperone TorD